jgi:hypothetical protein
LNDKTSAAAIVHQSLLDATAAFFQSSLKPRPMEVDHQQTGKNKTLLHQFSPNVSKWNPERNFNLLAVVQQQHCCWNHPDASAFNKNRLNCCTI